MNTARDTVLARIRAALTDVPHHAGTGPAEPGTAARDYLPAHVPDDPAALRDLLAENLADYRAHVHRTTAGALPALLARLLDDRGTRVLVTPPGLPTDWLTLATVEQLPDDGSLTAHTLESVDSVITGCALAIAETGTIVLDTGPGQGRRLLTLVPDHHICVVRADQVLASVPQALPLLDPARPQTWISGPSATSDIELDRVEGVHGPRTLEVCILD
ncbi:LUD domain-containing protein [Streptomyces sp. CB03911]|uniref:LutC/YkgG family protein n=1 Tax=Streptomyces sp. CB03911 TaxID=1804758 RepID=UPI00093D4F9B|nr:LUD domain-containing protein [Streptomyces sp. CB03911]OKI25602.1 lactate utilization protein C [Streptomyces sp. CB03911]